MTRFRLDIYKKGHCLKKYMILFLFGARLLPFEEVELLQLLPVPLMAVVELAVRSCSAVTKTTVKLLDGVPGRFRGSTGN